MILDYLWRYPPHITLLIMVDSVSVSYPRGLLVSIHSDVNEAARRSIPILFGFIHHLSTGRAVLECSVNLAFGVRVTKVHMRTS